MNIHTHLKKYIFDFLRVEDRVKYKIADGSYTLNKQIPIINEILSKCLCCNYGKISEGIQRHCAKSLTYGAPKVNIIQYELIFELLNYIEVTYGEYWAYPTPQVFLTMKKIWKILHKSRSK